MRVFKTVPATATDWKAPTPRGEVETTVAETYAADAPKRFADADGDIFAHGAFDDDEGRVVPVLYGHVYGDPGAQVGRGILHPESVGAVRPLRMRAQLNVGEAMADAVLERMFLADDHPKALREFSIGFEYDPADATKRQDGVHVIKKASVLEVSVVFRGSQRTELISVKCAGACTCGGACDAGAIPARAAADSIPVAALKEKMIRRHGDHDWVREIFGEPTRAEVAAKEAATRRAKARAEVEARCALEAGMPPGRVLVDPRTMRIVYDELHDPREADRKARDQERLDQADRERDAEADALVTALARHAHLDETRRYAR